MFCKGKLLPQDDTCGLRHRTTQSVVTQILPVESNVPFNYGVPIYKSEMILGHRSVFDEEIPVINRCLLPS